MSGTDKQEPLVPQANKVIARAPFISLSLSRSLALSVSICAALLTRPALLREQKGAQADT